MNKKRISSVLLSALILGQGIATSVIADENNSTTTSAITVSSHSRNERNVPITDWSYSDARWIKLTGYMD